MPCFNSAKFVKQAIDSALNQTFTKFELLIIDDGSTDNTLTIIKRISQNDHRIRIFSRPNRGISATRNFGLEQAKGEYISFLDSDDYWHSEKLKLQVATLEEYPNAILCYSRFLVWNNKNGFYETPDKIYESKEIMNDIDEVFSGWMYIKLLEDVYTWTGTILVRRHALKNAGGFNQDLVIGEDHDLWIRLSRIGHFKKLAAPLALYRENQDSITNKLHSQNYSAIVFENAVKQFGLKNPDGTGISSAHANDLRYKKWFRFAYQHFWGGNAKIARSAFLECFRYRIKLRNIGYLLATYLPIDFSGRK
jgi:glycosyltransferase involved in cell wall biosynthesis